MNIDCKITVGVIVRADKRTASRIIRSCVDDAQWERLYYSFVDSFVPDVDDELDGDGMGCIDCDDLTQLAALVSAIDEAKVEKGLSIGLQDAAATEPFDGKPGVERRASAWARWSDFTYPNRHKEAEISLFPSAVDSLIVRAARAAAHVLCVALSGRPQELDIAAKPR